MVPELRHKRWWPLFDSMVAGRWRRVPHHLVQLIDPEESLIQGRAVLISAIVCGPAIDYEEPLRKKHWY